MFVAGAHFYNYDMYGGLRAGGKASLVSRDYVGLAVSAFVSAFLYIGLRSGLVPMMGDRYAWSDPQERAVDRLTQMPAVFSFFVGVLSDAWPLQGYRRKSYMILGLVISLLCLLLLSLLCAFETTAKSVAGPAFTGIVVLLLATMSIGSMLTFVAVHTMVVMLSQQESLATRGTIQADYLLVRVCGQLIAEMAIFGFEKLGRAAHVPLVLTVCILAAVGALLATTKCLHEPASRRSHRIGETCLGYWRLTQQRAVWRILCFVCGFTFCLRFNLPDADRTLQTWAGSDYLTWSIISGAVTFTTVVVWRQWLMNALWKRVFAVAPVSVIATQSIVTSVTIFGVLRNATFFSVGTGLLGISTAFVSLGTLVPVTEIVSEGTEGGMVGLALSFYSLFRIFASTVMDALDGDTFLPEEAAVRDSSHDRCMVLVAQVVTYVVNALALGGVALLPLQKLDAQQLRTFGGFSTSAAVATVTVFLALLLYCSTYNAFLFTTHTTSAVVKLDKSHGP